MERGMAGKRRPPMTHAKPKVRQSRPELNVQKENAALVRRALRAADDCAPLQKIIIHRPLQQARVSLVRGDASGLQAHALTALQPGGGSDNSSFS